VAAVLTGAGVAAAAVVFASALASVSVAGLFALVCANAAPGSVKQTMAVRASRFMRFT
jgi:hypothetical protein